MKKLMRKIRLWLLELLNGDSREVRDAAFDAAVDHIAELDTIIKRLESAIGNYHATVREICRRSDDSYYDWCCEYCKMACDKQNGWCKSFTPKEQP